MTNETEVLIAGAGPTGLALALALARNGVRARVVDAAPAPSLHSKALGVQARTLETLALLGVAGDMLARGFVVRGLAVHGRGRRLARLSLDGLDTPYPFILSLPQSDTERVLIAALARAGIAPERPVELVSFRQDRAGVTAHLKDAAGRESECRALVLAGCDGAHSRVRRGANIGFPGAAYADDLRLLDCTVQGLAAADHANVFLGDGPPVGMIPMPGNLWRLIAVLRGANPDPVPPPGVAFFADLLARNLAPRLGLGEPVWASSFRVHRRLAGRYRDGRAFLAGDAAHIHSPAGGQGMNTGIQDAANLAWKLALVLRGEARDKLLDTYEAERRPVAQAVLAGTDRAMRALDAPPWLSLGMARALAPVLANVAPLRRWFMGGVAQLSLGYARGLAVGKGGGRRLADRPARRTNGKAAGLHGKLAPDRFTLFLKPAEESEREALERIARALVLRWERALRIEWLDAGPGRAWTVVRPDGVVGASGGIDDPEGPMKYFLGLRG